MRYSLRTLLLGTMACAIAAGIFVAPILRQKHAVQMLEAGGVSLIFYDAPVSEKEDRIYDSPLGPAWVDVFYDVSSIRLPWESPPLDLRCLRSFPRLRQLHLYDLPVTESDIRAIGRLNRLEELWLNYPITDDSLAELVKCGKLKYLILNAAGLTEQGIAHLSQLNSLENLRLRDGHFSGLGLEKLTGLTDLSLVNCEITNEGLDSIRQLTKLGELGLVNTPLTTIEGLDRMDALWSIDLSESAITDAGLRNIGNLKGLSKIGLTQTAISDAGLAHIANVAGLEELEIGFTQVTDRGMQSLNAMHHLKVLSVRHTQVTDAGIRSLACLSNLETLSVDGTAISQAAVDYVLHKQRATAEETALQIETRDK